MIDRIEDFRKQLAEWYAEAQRPLPWRTEPSLYRTVVSELMAQQTQIKTMLPYFERWMQRFPDFETLAKSQENEVLKHWEGLGYYSRARNLHKLAKAYSTATVKPRNREQWQALPGIGPYTSAAIASINFNEPVAVVDGNVVRILARLTCDERSFKNNGEAVKAFTELADKALATSTPGDHNQAMMELGATICLKRKPLCTLCPVKQFCESYGKEDLEAIPRIQRKATEKVEVQRAWVMRYGALLLHKIPEASGQLAGQYELPIYEQISQTKPTGSPILTRKRAITHRSITEQIYKIETAKELRLSADFYWINLSELDRITLSGPHRRWVAELVAESVAESLAKGEDEQQSA